MVELCARLSGTVACNAIIITKFTSEIAKIRKIRLMLKGYQKKFSEKRLAVLEGRDMGILFPNADVKFFFKCSVKVAAQRRFKEFEFMSAGINIRPDINY